MNVFSNNDHIVAQSSRYWLGLTQNWIYNQLRYLDSINSIILCYETKNLDMFPWNTIYQATFIDNLIYKFIQKFHINYRRIPNGFEAAIQLLQPSILHSHFGNRGWFDLPLVRKYSLKHVVTFYGYDVNMLPTQHQVWQERYRELFECVDLILCEGPHMAKVINGLGCSKSKIIVQRIGIEVNKIDFREREFKPGDPIKFLIIGSFLEKKGIPYALEAVGQFMRNYPDVEITIIGDSTREKRSAMEKQKILSVIEKYDLFDKTKFMGYQPYSIFINEAYKNHIFISPSVTASDGDTEGGAPITLIEMMATGIPIISTYHCDIPEIVIHRKTGLLANEYDIDGLVKNIDWWVYNHDKWKEITREGRAHITENFDVRTQAKKLKSIYENL